MAPSILVQIYFSLLVAAVFGALYLTTIAFAILHLWGPPKHQYFYAVALIAYLAHSSIIAALRTQARHKMWLLIVLAFEIDKAEAQAGWEPL